MEESHLDTDHIVPDLPPTQAERVKRFVSLVAFGLLLLATSIVMLSDDIRTLGWETTTGRVSAVDSAPVTGQRPEYTPRYSYQANNLTYVIRADDSSESKPDIGAERQIAYNPSNPTESLLKRSGIDYVVYVLPVAGVAIIAWAIAGFHRSRRNHLDDSVDRDTPADKRLESTP